MLTRYLLFLNRGQTKNDLFVRNNGQKVFNDDNLQATYFQILSLSKILNTVQKTRANTYKRLGTCIYCRQGCINSDDNKPENEDGLAILVE